MRPYRTRVSPQMADIVGHPADPSLEVSCDLLLTGVWRQPIVGRRVNVNGAMF
jgi:hypothetical protein